MVAFQVDFCFRPNRLTVRSLVESRYPDASRLPLRLLPLKARVTYLLAHLSDPHLGPLPEASARELMGKRVTGYLNWKRRKNIHNMGVLERLVADLRAQKPDHVMMTGDALNLGLRAEFAPAADWMRTLGDPDSVSFVPGNHDAYVRECVPVLAETFAPWMSGDARPDGAEPAQAWPYVRERGDLAMIGVNSAVPTALFLASGEIGAAQLDRLGRTLDAARERGLMRVVMIHHPPWRGGARFGRGLRDAAAFERVIADHGAELIVHGHNHRSFAALLPARGRLAPVVGVASASAVPGSPRHQAAYHLYRVEKSRGGWTIDARIRGIAAGSAAVVDLGPLSL